VQTNVGTILISVNPYKMLPLYTPSVMSAYRSRGSKEMAPHIYTIADDCYNSLIDEGISQSVVISGESGSVDGGQLVAHGLRSASQRLVDVYGQ